jgi:hypothetical protein
MTDRHLRGRHQGLHPTAPASIGLGALATAWALNASLLVLLALV